MTPDTTPAPMTHEDVERYRAANTALVCALDRLHDLATGDAYIENADVSIAEIINRALEMYRATLAAPFPECSGTPSDCPENEGYGCCHLREWKDRPLPREADAMRAELAALSSIKHPPRWALLRLCEIVRRFPYGQIEAERTRADALAAEVEKWRVQLANEERTVRGLNARIAELEAGIGRLADECESRFDDDAEDSSARVAFSRVATELRSLLRITPEEGA